MPRPSINLEPYGDEISTLYCCGISCPVPLSHAVVLFIRPPSHAHIDWHTLRSLLYLLRFAAPTSPDRDPAAMSALDKTQKAVLSLLEEWWTGQAQDNALPKLKLSHFLTALQSASDVDTFELHFGVLRDLVFEGDLPFLQEAARIQRLCLGASGKGYDHTRYMEAVEEVRQGYSEVGKDKYHRNLDILFSCELDLLDRTSYLSTFRQIAADIAAQERVGWHAMMHINMQNSCYMPSSDEPMLKDFPQPVPTILNPCSWLDADQADGLPWYLWHIKNSRTIETAQILSGDLRYAIVSHTWGRLRDGDAMESVCGVPWRVPKITRYDVRQLPRMITEAGFSEPYIWMDLLCIPQEMSVDWQLAICKAELPRQLAIFRSSSTAAIWLSDVAGWDSTVGAIAWMGLKSLSKDPTSLARYNKLFDLDSGCDAIVPSASSACDLIKEEISGDAENNEEEVIPSAWFTSLWTLQEIMIRPDMIMLDKNWRPLAVGNKLLITLDSLVSLAGELSAIRGAPKGVATLTSMFYDHHLSLLRTESRLVPLVLGANRVSTSPRAPAIMSAIGATDWFRGRTLQQFQSPEEADQLVLGSYPLDFVEEVRSLCGAEFFSCSTAIATLVIDPVSGTEPAPGYPLRGTMLPFMPVPDELYQSTFEPSDSEIHDTDHPSVGSWRIHRDGSVTLPTAAVIASNSISLQTSCQLTLYTVEKLSPLHDWIRRFNGEAHALCVSFSEEHMVGIILHRLQDSDSFVKAGTFRFGWPDTYVDPDGDTRVNPGFMTVLDVNWHVL
ncbi:hypothetical protein BDW68DRAFT_186312 [Aspergillus falconensis]